VDVTLVEQSVGTLEITVVPGDARITLPDIGPRYTPGMELEPGEYRVLVAREGYQTQRQSIEIQEGRRTTRTFTLERTQRRVGEVFSDRLKSGGTGPEMVVLPTGNFRMGDLSGDGDEDEKPIRRAKVRRSIAMGKYEVTFADYDLFIRATDHSQVSDEGWGRGTHPVINVSWNDATEYAEWLSGETGRRYRLPSELEWEYAARAGSVTKYSWGDAVETNRANCSGCGSRWDADQTAPVGSFVANAFGLHDMHGNVWEWVEDCYEGTYEGAPRSGRARSRCTGTQYRVQRGGSWNSYPIHLRAASRNWVSPSSRYGSSGFRLVQDLEP
ncbi:MAG: SUMF1/EgtB/PvdO family nonheme iron enzyme, partial [Pseudomonadota bacterium]